MTLKITASWCNSMTAETIPDKVRRARNLGFNAFAWVAEEMDALFLQVCRENDMKAYKVLEPLTERTGAVLQELEPGEEEFPGVKEPGHLYQFGGEPVQAHSEVLDKVLVCPRDESVISYTAGEVKKASDMGYDGVCWDFIGYRNYRSCSCELCKEGLKKYEIDNPHLNIEAAKEGYYELVLLELYTRLYDTVKEIAPGMKVMCHCHPVFEPNPFYGLKAKSDYCGITVSWFFQPHWDMAKVDEYIKRTVEGPYTYKEAIGMPMLGYYSIGGFERHRKSGERLYKELELTVRLEAGAVMLCELDSVLACEEAAESVKRTLL